MNQKQITYAVDRAKAIHAAREEKLVERFTTPAVKLTLDERIAALRAGAFTIKEDPPEYRYRRDIGCWIVFNGEREATKDEAALGVAVQELDKAYRQLTDELMLGTESEALKLLRAFETGE